jgi:hypothetical protein
MDPVARVRTYTAGLVSLSCAYRLTPPFIPTPDMSDFTLVSAYFRRAGLRSDSTVLYFGD